MNINDKYGDMVCVEIIPWTDFRNPLKNKQTTVYRMKCTKCGREKIKPRYSIEKLEGMFHKDCGRFEHLKDPVFYNRWKNLRDRTTNKTKKEADRYVNRGIDSEEFKYFIDFYDAMYDSWLEMKTEYPVSQISLDRIDNNKGYSKENCRWVYYKDQYKNMSSNNFFGNNKYFYWRKRIYTMCYQLV